MNLLLEKMKLGIRPPGASALAAPPRPAIQKLRYTHEAMVEQIIANPWISQNELGELFGFSASWVSTVIASDLFQSKLAERRDQLIDPELRASIKTQFSGLLARSMEILRAKLDRPPAEVPDQLALQTAKIMSQNLGHGVETKPQTVVEVHNHLEALGENLVGLLRRRRTEAEAIEIPAECGRSGPPANRLEHSNSGGFAPEPISQSS